MRSAWLRALAVVTVGFGGLLYVAGAARAATSDPTQLTLSVPAHVAYPQQLTVQGTLTDTATNQPLAGQPVEVFYHYLGHPQWVLQKIVDTDQNGQLTYRFRILEQTFVRLVYQGSTNPPAAPADTSSTSVPTVTVQPYFRIGAPADLPTFTTGYLTGVIRPAWGDEYGVIDRYTGSRWVTTPHRVYFDKAGKFSYPLQYSSAGVVRYRVTVPPTHGDDGVVSPYVTITIFDRSLSQGMSGPDVVALQRRLAALHYYPVPQTGQFDYDTMQAVVAFQKVNQLLSNSGGINPNWGTADARTLTALGHPVTPRLPVTFSGPAMEADLTHQVVYYAVNGQVERIMDSSTGGGYWYTEYGASYQAITPEGQFSVQRIVDGPVTSPLGWLWRPAYFTGGYAIHGEPEVPPYPVSHGCIRIIMDAQDGMFPLYFVGMPVYVYGNPPYAG